MEQNYQKSRAPAAERFKVGQLIKLACRTSLIYAVTDRDGLIDGIDLVECQIDPGQIGMIVKHLKIDNWLVLFGESLVNMSPQYMAGV